MEVHESRWETSFYAARIGPGVATLKGRFVHLKMDSPVPKKADSENQKKHSTIDEKKENVQKKFGHS